MWFFDHHALLPFITPFPLFGLGEFITQGDHWSTFLSNEDDLVSYFFNFQGILNRVNREFSIFSNNWAFQNLIKYSLLWYCTLCFKLFEKLKHCVCIINGNFSAIELVIFCQHFEKTNFCDQRKVTIWCQLKKRNKCKLKDILKMITSFWNIGKKLTKSYGSKYLVSSLYSVVTMYWDNRYLIRMLSISPHFMFYFE